MADDRDESGDEGDVSGDVPAGFEAEPPSYRSGRVRIIGAEPAGNAVHEVTGPVVEENSDMPHWNDAPTGQVPAILDRGNGDEQTLAPPSWREEDTDWAAQSVSSSRQLGGASADSSPFPRSRMAGTCPVGASFQCGMSGFSSTTGPVTSWTALPAGSAPMMRTRPDR